VGIVLWSLGIRFQASTHAQLRPKLRSERERFWVEGKPPVKVVDPRVAEIMAAVSKSKKTIFD